MIKAEKYMNDQWKGVIGDYGMLTGFAIRLNDFLRVSGGAVWMQVKDPNPTISTKSIQVLPYASLALDIDMIGYIEKMAENIKLNKLSK